MKGNMIEKERRSLIRVHPEFKVISPFTVGPQGADGSPQCPDDSLLSSNTDRLDSTSFWQQINGLTTVCIHSTRGTSDCSATEALPLFSIK